MLGAVLAGGRARRLGGAGKAALPLAGRPLIAWPLAALRAVLADVVVVAKPATALPPLDVPVLLEPAEPHHPAVGLARALAQGRPVLACAADLPLVTPEAVARLAARPGLAVACAGGRIQPLLARYPPGTSLPATGRLSEAVAALHPELVEVPPGVLLNVNDEADLAAARAALEPPG